MGTRLAIPSASPGVQTGNGKPPDTPDSTDETLYLLGRPTLSSLVEFARSHALHPPGEAVLGEAWHGAAAVVRRLETEEAGRADDPPIHKLGPEYEPQLIEFLKDPLVRGGFNTVPTEIALVDLDRLVVSQRHIDVSFAKTLERRLAPALTRDEVFRICLPFDHPHPPVSWSRVKSGKYVFVSPSNDLRFLGGMQMTPQNIRDYPPPGSVVGVVGLAVGFGSNFLNALYVEKRLILNNGSHRAYALRRMGVTQLPCIVQHVSTREELERVALPAVQKRPDLYLKKRRPPMLVDYFDERLHKVFPVHRRTRQVTIRYQVEEEYVPAV